MAGHVRHVAHVDSGRRQAGARLVAAHEPLLEHRPADHATRARHAAADGRPAPRHAHVRLRLAPTRRRVLGRRSHHSLARAATSGRVLSPRHGRAGAAGCARPHLDQAGRSPQPDSLRSRHDPSFLRPRRGTGPLAGAGPHQKGARSIPGPLPRQDEPGALLVGGVRSRLHALLRSSGPAPPRRYPNLADSVTRESYSHECISMGWWLGGGLTPILEPSFYAYAYPEPPGCPDAVIAPVGASYDPRMHEWILPYEAGWRPSGADSPPLEL